MAAKKLILVFLLFSAFSFINVSSVGVYNDINYMISSLDQLPQCQQSSFKTGVDELKSRARSLEKSVIEKGKKLAKTQGELEELEEIIKEKKRLLREKSKLSKSLESDLQEKYRNEMVARYGPDQDNHPSFDGAAWCEASGGVSKGRVYGAPRMPKSKVDVSSSAHTYSVNSSYPSTTTNRQYQEQLDKMETKISSIEDCLKLLVGHMGLSMPTPVAPSMPSPTMTPGYQPRPRPRPQMPYNGLSSSHQQHRRSFPP